MWVEVVCGLLIYWLLRRYFFGSDDPDDSSADFSSSPSTAVFSVADRLQNLYGGKAYVGLRIPDADTASRQNIDLVLITKREALVISVKTFSGILQAKEEERRRRQFDMNMAYGPCVGMSRMARWERASSLGLNPPNEVHHLLVASASGSGSSDKNKKATRSGSLWDGRV